MEYIYAALLLHRAGKPISEENLIHVLDAAGVNPDLIRVKALVASLAEVNIDEAIKASPAFMPVTLAPTVAPAPPEAKPAEEKKKREEEEEREEEERALEGLGALFR
ncbi:MAG: 50S ribosomal protein L12 [Candidatus Bathyarchaeota archaeon BA1]|nr:MAG: 50S ribosomal protein L12 [Candidatus Bathyarchaeota archaeon BA1]